MQWIKSLAIPLACLAVGYGVGRWFPMAPEVVRGGDAPVAVPARASRTTPTRPDAAAPVDVPDEARLRVTAEMLEKLSHAQGIRKLDEDLFSGTGVVEEALEITPTEKAAIQTSWRATQTKIRTLETDAVRHEAIDEWTQQITVPDLTSTMAALAAVFQGEVRKTLGDNRADVFLAAKQVDNMFDHARSGRTLKVTTEEIGNGDWRFRIEQDGGEGRRVWLGEAIPAELRHLTDAAGISPTLSP